MQTQLQYVGSSSLTKDWTWALALGVRSLSHWTTREVPEGASFKTLSCLLEHSLTHLLTYYLWNVQPSYSLMGYFLFLSFNVLENDCTNLKCGVLVAQLCPTLCDPMDYSSPGFSVHGIFQWSGIPFSRAPSQPMNWTHVSWIVGRFFTIWATMRCPQCEIHLLQNQESRSYHPKCAHPSDHVLKAQ